MLCVSHGMGGPSVGILLHEMIKLMYHAKCKDPIFIRIGTCGGIGVEGGTVIITEDAIDGQFRSTFELVSIKLIVYVTICKRKKKTHVGVIRKYLLFSQPILGKLVQRPTKLDKKLARELKGLADPTMDPYDTVIGKTMCANDFYEGINKFFFYFIILDGLLHIKSITLLY